MRNSPARASRDGAMTLASIVYEETKRKDEMPVVAGFISTG